MAIVLDGTNGVTTNSGTLISATTIGVGGATAAASGAGITFPATASASSDANTLDDYEEGTWTPTINTTGSGTCSNQNQNGYYTKIGRVVIAHYYVEAQRGTASSGSIQLSGLPFTSTSATNFMSENTTLVDNLTTAISNIVTQIYSGISVCDFITGNGGTGTHAGMSYTYMNTSTWMAFRGYVVYIAA